MFLAEDALQLLKASDRLSDGKGASRKRKTGNVMSVFILGHSKSFYQHKPDNSVVLQDAADSEHASKKKQKILIKEKR